MRLILMGPPGSGKGTQAEFISKEFGIVHISTGDMFRKAISEKTDLGSKAKEFLDSGRLVPDEVTVGIVRERIQEADCHQGFLLDGFPRTVAQAEALDEFIALMPFELDAVINIEVPRDEILKRLTGRRICKDCGATYHVAFSPPLQPDRCDKCGGDLYQRDDDTESTINKRLDVYKDQTEPLIAYYADRGLLRNINGSQEIKAVLKEIINSLGKSSPRGKQEEQKR